MTRAGVISSCSVGRSVGIGRSVSASERSWQLEEEVVVRWTPRGVVAVAAAEGVSGVG